jgi:hypothetical protein
MNEEILSDIRNKLTAPKIALEKLANGEKLPREYLELALKELKSIIVLLNGKRSKKCKCDVSDCAKCLGINCQDKNCSVHTKERKKAWRDRWEKAKKKPFPHPIKY